MPTPQEMAKALMQGPPKPKQQSVQKPVGEKITRDAFLYLDGDDESFAQCGSCVFGPDKCSVMGGRPVNPDVGTCGFYIQGNSIGQPIANMTPEETGYTERPVRCENCIYFGKNKCGLFEELNSQFPDKFELDTKVQPYGCCNGNTPGANA